MHDFATGKYWRLLAAAFVACLSLTTAAESPNAAVAGNYRAELRDGRLRLLWKDELLVDDFMPLLVAENWSKTYANEGYLGALTAEECSFDGDTLTLTATWTEGENSTTLTGGESGVAKTYTATEDGSFVVSVDIPSASALEFELKKIA